jgi:polyhydroxybutyrate depolymerase
VAPDSGSLETDPCQPVRPVPLMDIHGTDDKFIPFYGGGLFGFHSVPYTIDHWVSINGCPSTPTVVQMPDNIDDGTHVSINTYGPCRGGSEVVSVVIDGAGHNWPGMEVKYPYLFGKKILGPINWEAQRSLVGTVTYHFKAGDLMWDFFLRHPMNATPSVP